MPTETPPRPRLRSRGRGRDADIQHEPNVENEAGVGSSRLARRRRRDKRAGSDRPGAVTSRRRLAPPGHKSGNFVGLFVLTLILNVIGLVMVLSASTITGLETTGSSWYFFQRQLIWAALGLVAMIALMRTDYRRLREHAQLALVVIGVALMFVLLPGIGVGANGSTRWIGTATVSVQPAEFAKVAVAIFCAAWLADRADVFTDTRVTLRPVLLISGFVALLVLLQRSQGTAMIIVAIAFVMLFASGVPLLPLARIGLGLATLATVLALTQGYRMRRITAFLDPWADPLDSGYQTIQSLVGVASGGVTGVGLGAGRAKWGFLPFAHTDFIFAVIAEELGLIGSVFVLLAFVGIVFFGWRTALAAPDRFGMLLAIGITTWIAVQAFINIAVVLGVLPISGVPLPFVSIGGSSLVATMMAMGIVLNIARQPRAV